MVMRVTLGGSFIKRNFGLVFGGIWLVVGTPLLVGGIAMWIQEHRFAHDALTVEGKVLTRDIHTAHNSNSTGSATSTQYQVSYRFLAPDGITREGRSNVDVHLWENLHEQGPVTISYLPGDPAANRVAGKPDWVGPVILAGLGGFLALRVAPSLLSRSANACRAGGCYTAAWPPRRPSRPWSQPISRSIMCRSGSSATATMTTADAGTRARVPISRRRRRMHGRKVTAARSSTTANIRTRVCGSGASNCDSTAGC